MATFEQVERLKEKANVSYEDAKAALDATDGDMLEAIIYLEKNGKVAPPMGGGYYNSQDAAQPKPPAVEAAQAQKNEETIPMLLKRFFRWAIRMFNKGNRNSFEVRKNDSVIISVPVTVLVFLVIFAFWIVVPLIILGLFFGCRYVFRGPDLDGAPVNGMMDSAANAAENFKAEMTDDDK